MTSNGVTYPVVVLNNGLVVLAKHVEGYGLMAKTFANITQARRAAEQIGGRVWTRGIPFYVVPPPFEQTPIAQEGGA